MGAKENADRFIQAQQEENEKIWRRVEQFLEVEKSEQYDPDWLYEQAGTSFGKSYFDTLVKPVANYAAACVFANSEAVPSIKEGVCNVVIVTDPDHHFTDCSLDDFLRVIDGGVGTPDELRKTAAQLRLHADRIDLAAAREEQISQSHAQHQPVAAPSPELGRP